MKMIHRMRLIGQQQKTKKMMNELKKHWKPVFCQRNELSSLIEAKIVKCQQPHREEHVENRDYLQIEFDHQSNN